MGSEAYEGAEVAEVGRAGDGEGDDADLGVAGLGELGRLADIFGDDQLARDFAGKAKACEGFVGSKAVGGMKPVRNCNLLDFGAGEAVEGEGLRWRILAGPQDEDAMGIGDGDTAGGEIRCDELFGVDIVGGKKDVLGITVGDLLGEGCGGAEGGNDFDACRLLILGGERWKYGL